MKSLEDISILEKAYECGAKSLGSAAVALKVRWDAGLRDQETFIRLAFLSWYSLSEPGYYTGLDQAKDLPTVNDMFESFGGASALEPDSLFVLGLLSHGYPFYCGDEKVWQNRSSELFDLAAKCTPSSSVLTNWRYLLRITNEPNGLRKNIEPELHARFSGRGYMGTYVLHICKSGRSSRGDVR